MTHKEELMQTISAIYRFVYANKNIHKNIVRKKVLQKSKFISKPKFNEAFDLLVKTGSLVVDKENVSLNPGFIKVGVLQKKGQDFYVVTPESDKHYDVEKSVASGYKCGDLLSVVVSNSDGKKSALVLGRTEKQKEKVVEQKTVAVQEKKQEKAKSTEVVIPVKEQEKFLPKIELQDDSLVLGRVVKISHDNLIFIPNKKSFEIRQIPILNPKEDVSAFQDKLCVMRLKDLQNADFGGYIVEIKGDAGNPIHEYDAIAENYGAIMHWRGKELEQEIAQIPTAVDLTQASLIDEDIAKYSQRGKVVDLRHIPFVTVDPATCKDMDDAIYSTFDENGDFVTYTAVANVTKYVDLDSEIGQKYVQGGFTIYAPNKAYSILPSQLSTGICSLNPDEDRLAFVVKTVVDKTTGKVKSSNIYDAVIQSRKKYSYEQAQEIVDEMEESISPEMLEYKALRKEPLTLEEQVLMNYYAAQAIKTGFDRRRMIRFVSNKEREVVFDSDLQNIVDINPVQHLFYHEVIEAFMITANEATAKYAKDNNLNNIFRTHEEPNPRKVDRATEFFDILGIEFDGDLSAEGTRSLIDLISNTANEEIINKFLIKMQSRAVYSNHLYSDRQKEEDVPEWVGERISHYALQSPHYSHTTSPIRRVPDYITQYNILAHIHGTKPLSAEFIREVVEIANDRQIDVDQAEKDFDDINSVIYCEKHIGEVMRGRVTKLRYSSYEEGYNEDIVVIVKNEEKGINVEIPLSQILGRQTGDCELSAQKCAVYDRRGNTLLTICKPVDFIIAQADRKMMRVVGKTNKEMVRSAEQRETKAQTDYRKGNNGHQASYVNSKHAGNRVKKHKRKNNHSHKHNDGREESYDK